MQDIKSTVSKNIATLRVQNGLTQLELAEKLNYSDKAVSKWERGESLPDITAFCEMSEIFGVSVDDILKSEEIGQIVKKQKKERRYNLKVIKYIVDGFIWTAALLTFVVTVVVNGGKIGYSWLYFVYALPVEFIVTLVLNSVWFDKRKNYFIVSGILWSVLAALYSTFMFFNLPKHTWLIFLLGIAGEVIIVLWSFIRPKSKENSRGQK